MYAAVNCYWVLIHVKSVSLIYLALSAPSIRPYTGQTEVLEGSTKYIKCETKGSPKPTVDWYRNGKKMNVTNCHSNPQSCDKVDYEVYEERDGSSGLHTIYTVQVLKIRVHYIQEMLVNLNVLHQMEFHQMLSWLSAWMFKVPISKGIPLYFM